MKWQPFYLTTVSGIAENHNRRSLSIRDIFSASDSNPILKICISNYMVDIHWLINECPIFLTVPTLCMHGSTQPTQISLDNINICRVDMGAERYGTHHSKFAIIFYQSGVRICITTANFIPEDFEYRTQGVYLQDFPLKSNTLHTSNPKYNDFEVSFLEYLNLIHLGKTARAMLNSMTTNISNYDLSSAEIVLIPSIPGRHSPQNMNKFGIMKLSLSLKEEYANNNIDAEVDQETLVMQFSSLGSMGKDAKLVDEYADYMMPTSSTINKAKKKRIEIVWPTAKCVRESLQGYDAGGSLPCSAKNILVNGTNNVFLPGFAGRMRVWSGIPSGRERATPHMKCYFAYKQTDSSGKDGCISSEVEMSWFLLTSSNLSQAAWGVVQHSGRSLYIKSYELGVLFLPSKVKQHRRLYSNTPSHPLLGVDAVEYVDLSEDIPHSSSSTSSSSEMNNPIVGKANEMVWSKDSTRKRCREDYERSHNAGKSRFVVSQSPITAHPFVVHFPVPFQIPAQSYRTDGVSRNGDGEMDVPWVWDKRHPQPDCFGRIFNPT